MSLFDSIKGTILSVPKDISSGIKSLTTITKEIPIEHGEGGDSEQDSVASLQSEVDHEAGSELLSKFQNDWIAIHQASEETAKQAKAVDSLVNDTFLYLERQNAAVNLFLMETSVLPQLIIDLKGAASRLCDLESQFDVVESELRMLEDVCEVQELQTNKRHHKYQLEKYRQRCSTQLEQSKVQMAKDHVGRVQHYEHHLQKSLREKQHAFEATFKQEMQHYKKYGKTSPAFQVKPSPERKSADLADFCPENDSSLLDDFLKGTETEDVKDASAETKDSEASGENSASNTQQVEPLGDQVVSGSSEMKNPLAVKAADMEEKDDETATEHNNVEEKTEVMTNEQVQNQIAPESANKNELDNVEST